MIPHYDLGIALEKTEFNLTKSKEVQVTASSKKDGALNPAVVEDIDALKTQKRHKRNLMNIAGGEQHPKEKDQKLKILPETSMFSLDKEEKPKETLPRKISHIRGDSNKSGTLSVSRPSSSTKKVHKTIDQPQSLTLKRAIQRVKVSLNPSATIAKPNTSISSIKSAKPSLVKSPQVAPDTSTLRGKIEVNLEKDKHKALDRISRKIASLIRESGNMKVAKLAKKETQSSTSRDSIVSNSQRKLTNSSIKPTLTGNFLRKGQVSRDLTFSNHKLKPVLEEYKVTKVVKKEKTVTSATDQLAIEQKITTSNYSCSSQLSSGREYLHKSKMKDSGIARENPYLNRTSRSSTSNSRLSSRGASISGATKPQQPTTSENPTSLKNLLKQIHCKGKEPWNKPEAQNVKKPATKPLAVPSSPFVRLKPKSSQIGITTSQRFK